MADRVPLPLEKVGPRGSHFGKRVPLSSQAGKWAAVRTIDAFGAKLLSGKWDRFRRRAGRRILEKFPGATEGGMRFILAPTARSAGETTGHAGIGNSNIVRHDDQRPMLLQPVTEKAEVSGRHHVSQVVNVDTVHRYASCRANRGMILGRSFISTTGIQTTGSNGLPNCSSGTLK